MTAMDRFVFCPGPRRVVVREASGSHVRRGPTHENVGVEIDWVEHGVMGTSPPRKTR